MQRNDSQKNGSALEEDDQFLYMLSGSEVLLFLPTYAATFLH